jgi:hypothetical protein
MLHDMRWRRLPMLQDMPGRLLRHWCRSDERQVTPLRVAERADEVAMRDAGGDAAEVEGVGALRREGGLPIAGGAAADGARICLSTNKTLTVFNSGIDDEHTQKMAISSILHQSTLEKFRGHLQLV